MNMENLQPNPNSDALKGGTPLGLLRRVDKLRAKIKARSAELGIVPDHDKKAHYYKVMGEVWGPAQGKRYDSVSKHTGLLKDPSLTYWYMNRALEYVESNKDEAYSVLGQSIGGSKEALQEFIQNAKQAPVLEFEGAGSIGKQVHDWRQVWFDRCIKTDLVDSSKLFEPYNQFEGPVMSGCRGLQKFMKDTGYIPLATELYVADSKLGIGGTLDDIGLLDGKLVLIDLKTSNIGDKESHYAQVCLYLAMFKKLYRLHPKGVYILHLSKDDGTYDLIPLHDRCDIRRTTRWAKQVVRVSQGLDELKAGKKIKPRII